MGLVSASIMAAFAITATVQGEYPATATFGGLALVAAAGTLLAHRVRVRLSFFTQVIVSLAGFVAMAVVMTIAALLDDSPARVLAGIAAVLSWGLSIGAVYVLTRRKAWALITPSAERASESQESGADEPSDPPNP